MQPLKERVWLKRLWKLSRPWSVDEISSVDELLGILPRQTQVDTTQSLNISRQRVEVDMDSEELTEFEDQGSLDIITKENCAPMNIRGTGSREMKDHTIISFLNRPRNIATLVWSGASAPLTLLATWNIPTDILTTSMPLCKASDFRFFRCNVVFHFKLNAQKMAVGSLMAVIIPKPVGAGAQIHDDSLTQLSAYPCGFIDAGSSPSLKMVVPYVDLTSAYDLLNDTEPWAQLRLYVMNSLNAATGSTTADISLWVSCVDVQLTVPTPNHLESPGFAQSEGEKEAKTGSISGVAAKVSSITSTVASLGLGPVSEIAAAATWVSDIVGSTAAAFGFAKPRTMATTVPMVQQPARQLMNYNGEDHSVSMSFDAKNSLDINQRVFGVNIDEMDINYVCSKPCFIETFNWSSSSPAFTILRSWPVTPGFCGDSSTTVVTPTLMAYVASLFQYWSGGIAYKLNFVANAFYSGRIGVAFLSGHTTISSPIDPAIIEAAPRVICDIRSTRSCVLEVPWAMNLPYNLVRLGSRTGAGALSYNVLRNLVSSTGLVVVYVQNALTVTGAIPTTIDINLFAYGMPDLEFAVPTAPNYTPVRYQAPAPLRALRKRKRPEVVSSTDKDEEPADSLDEFEPLGFAQSETDETPKNLNGAAGQPPKAVPFLEKVPSKPKNVDRGRLAIGERVSSLRQLCRQFSYLGNVNLASGDSLQVDPRWFDYDDDSALSSREARVSRIYAFQRGSRLFKFLPAVPPDTNYPVINVFSALENNGPPLAPFTGATPLPGTLDSLVYPYFVNVAQTPVIEVSVPFYSQYYNDVISNLSGSRRPAIILQPGYTSTASTVIDIFSAAGDDMSFGYLIGPPLMQLYT